MTPLRFVILVATILFAAPAFAAERPTIAAASDLSYALPEVTAAFTRDSGRSLTVAFGSSGNFTQQILNGAPFELFLSADEEYVDRLHAAGKTVDEGMLYAVGHIGIFTPKGSPLKADAELRDLATALADGRVKRFAIANPEHAPYGRAARAALMHAGLWEAIKDRLVLGENVSQAAQFAASGSAQGGIVPLSLAKAPALANAGTFVQLPANWHPPLRQKMVLLKGARDTAKAFYAYMQTASARAILARYGFVLPGD